MQHGIYQCKSNFRNYNDACILIRGNITIAKQIVTKVAFKTFERFIKCITKVDETPKGYSEERHLVMVIYNLLEYNSN